MKKSRILLIVVLIVSGVAMLFYPCLNMILSGREQTVAVFRYEEGSLHYNEEEKQAELKKAAEYNNSINGSDVQDPFIPGSGVVLPENYTEVLDVDMGMMGTLEIPCIDVNLPIYHGVAEEVLKKGVGHLKETAFPIGGEGNHTVLSTHRGLPEAKLFTDLDKMEIGDEFYIHIFDEILAYRVDQIEVIEPSDTSLLKPVKGKDYVTLLTCTPYGINSHRLLVRGVRTEYVPETKEQAQEKVTHTEYYMPIAVLAVFIFAFLLQNRKRRSKRRGKK